MNCATHNDVAAVAFCRTCGKPLCQTCTRDVRGVIYCESCLAARLDGTVPAAGFVPPQAPTPPPTGYQQFMDQGLGVKVGPGPSSGPNPAVAGILAGFFPIGVGAVYTGQYAKGLAHLVIAVLMILGVSSDLPWYVIMVIGISMGFFYIYQIMDAVRSAKAVQLGQPMPDPFGLAQTFGAGERFESTKVPAGAAVLIGLGLLFLLHTIGIFEFGLDHFWPLILIFLGVWLFAKHWGLIGGNSMLCRCERCRTNKLMGPAMLVTLGVLFLLDSVGRVGFGRTWPAILLVIGVVKLMQSNASYDGHIGTLPPAGSANIPPVAPPPPAAPQGPEQPSSSGEVNHV
jgi:LiaI-LiaF-like transmembrane region/B-box zinc finger